MPDPWQMKRCRHCGEHKLLEEFYRDSAQRDGRDRWCMECRRYPRHVMSLEMPLGDDLRLGDTIESPVVEEERYDDVLRVLWANVDAHIITQRQAAAVLLHAVDQVPITLIAEQAGITKHAVYLHYQAGIRNLRRAYA